MTYGDELKQACSEGDDLPPSGEEARAQRRQTSMPLVWMVVGLIVVAAFVVMLARGGAFGVGPSGPLPVRTPGSSLAAPGHA